jgi:hypothetical protein
VQTPSGHYCQSMVKRAYIVVIIGENSFFVFMSKYEQLLHFVQCSHTHKYFISAEPILP